MPTILVIEDRPADQAFLKTLLGTAGYDVLIASDGAEAFDLLHGEVPGLVISDILMPTTNGCELVRRMQGIPALASVPVVFYAAAYHESEARALASRCGAVDIVTRPASPDLVLAKVSAAIAHGTPAASSVSRPRCNDRANPDGSVPAGTAGSGDLDVGRLRMAAVAEVCHQIAGERDVRALLQNVCDQARRATLAQFAAIGLDGDSLSNLQAMVTSGISAADQAQLDIVPFADGILNSIFRDRRSIRWRRQDRTEDGRCSSDTAPPLAAFLCVPIASQARVYGWLGQWNKLGADGFDDLDEQITVTLGTQTGIAYENAQRYDDLARHATGLENEIAQRQRADEQLHDRREESAPIAALARTEIAPAPPRSGAETVLVIEDEEAVRVLIRVLLERAGYHVIDAECADQGESLFLENPNAIDLVISDVVMPGMSGPSLLKRLTAHHPGLKAIFISGYPVGESGYPEDEIAEESLAAPEIAFLQKPFSAVNLVRKVRQVLDR